MELFTHWSFCFFLSVVAVAVSFYLCTKITAIFGYKEKRLSALSIYDGNKTQRLKYAEQLAKYKAEDNVTNLRREMMYNPPKN